MPKPPEIWRPVPGFSRYQVSSYGDLRDYNPIFRGVGTHDLQRDSDGKVFRNLISNNCTYRQIWLWGDNGVKVRTRIHTIVLLTFVGPRPEGMECRHLDGNSLNNCLSNLCWGTPKENHDDKRRHGTTPKGVLHPKVKLAESDVLEIRSLYETGWSVCRLSRKYGVTHSQVSRILSRTRWGHI